VSGANIKNMLSPTVLLPLVHLWHDASFSTGIVLFTNSVCC
jgi:hypothetical protein